MTPGGPGGAGRRHPRLRHDLGQHGGGSPAREPGRTQGGPGRSREIIRRRLAAGPGLSLPFQLALLERDDGRRLRRAGDRQSAVERLRQARDHLADLGALPYVAACERELAHCGAEIRPEQRPAWNLTASELAVARLVCTGRSNREVAGELYVSVKAVEFHLGHVFDKIGIRSRKDLAARLEAPGGNRGQANLGSHPSASPSDSADQPGHYRRMAAGDRPPTRPGGRHVRQEISCERTTGSRAAGAPGGVGMSVELIIVIVVVLVAIGIAIVRKSARALSPRGGGAAKAPGMSKNPGSLATPTGSVMQTARDDAEPAVLTGRREGAGLPLAVDLRGVRKSFGPVQAVRGVALAVGAGR